LVPTFKAVAAALVGIEDECNCIPAVKELLEGCCLRAPSSYDLEFALVAVLAVSVVVVVERIVIL
jgi:hypothetical protein